MRLINADALIQSLEKKHEHWHELVTEENKEIEFAHSYALNVIRNAPTISEDWIPCGERLPKDLDPVNATWVNHNPPCYYMDLMNVPFTSTCVRYKGKWYWWDTTICDLLAEYGEQYAAEPINKYIEVIAWMPLPEPYKEEYDEN